MNAKTIILVGAGGHARSCIDVIEQQKRYKIVGIVGLPNQKNSQLLGYDVIGVDDDLENLAKIFTHALITVGFITTIKNRFELYQKTCKAGFILPVHISPTAIVSPHAKIEAGTIVMPGAIVNAGARIGKNCIINSRALIEHDSIVEDHCHISTGAILNGDVRVGTGSFIGSGSIIKEGISIGNECIVGMAQSVRHSIEDRERIK